MARINITTILGAVLLTALIVVSAICGGVVNAYAAVAEYTNVLEDLQTDSTFKASKYPAKSGDYKLEVIQIAENTDGGLFVYVYQPSGQASDLRATTLRLARVKGGLYLDYGLTFVSSSGVFYKYSVQNVHVYDNEAVRYYDITAIHRKYNSAYDSPSDNPTQTVNEVVFEVGQVWEVTTGSDGNVTYRMEYTDVVVIKPHEKMIGLRRLSNIGKPWLLYDSCDAHFIAFNCDHEIDELFEADVTFVTQDYRMTVAGTTKYDPEPQFRRVYGDTSVKNKPYGAFGQSYKWERIQPVAEFLKETDGLSSEDRSELLKYTWVINFYETEFGGYNGLVGAGLAMTSPATIWASLPLLLATNCTGTVVSEVSVLKLEFQTGGVVYNLGVVDDKRTGPGVPIGGDEPLSDFWIYALVIVILLIAVNVAFAFLNKIIGNKAMVILSSFTVLLITAILRVCASVYIDKFLWLESCIVWLNVACWVLLGLFGIILIVSLIQALRGNGGKGK